MVVRKMRDSDPLERPNIGTKSFHRLGNDSRRRTTHSPSTQDTRSREEVGYETGSSSGAKTRIRGVDNLNMSST